MAAPKTAPAPPPHMRLEQVADILLERHREQTVKELEEKKREIISEALGALEDSPLPDWFPEVAWDYVDHDEETVLVRDELDLDGTGIVVGIVRGSGEVFIPMTTVGLRLPITSALALASYVVGVQG